MVFITVEGNTQGAFDRALTEFSRQVKRSGIMYDLRIREHFETKREQKIRRLDDSRRRKKKVGYKKTRKY